MVAKSDTELDAVIVGAGFAGIHMLSSLISFGYSAIVLEAGDEVGGTWNWNRYPGARCDTESMFYSYGFSEALQQEWNWSERYPKQPEILSYAKHVVERFNLSNNIKFNTRVININWNKKNRKWGLETEKGERISANFCIMATGCLSSPNYPNIEGLDDFEGEIYHTGRWPKYDVVFDNKNIAVIGNGSSGIQAITEIAKTAPLLNIFQRTANYVVPAHNRHLNPQEVADIKSNYSTLREKAKETYSGNIFESGGPSALAVSVDERIAEYESRWNNGGLCFMAAYDDLQSNTEANRTAAEFIENKIREIVKDKKTADKLIPKNSFGCKRLCVASGYYETFNLPNVNLVDLNENPLKRVTNNSINAGDSEYKTDLIVLATGFDAMTGALNKINISGINGSLKEKWETGPKSYLGLMSHNFPNMFTITGPGSPSVLTNMMTSIEQHVEWISTCLEYMKNNRFTCIEPHLKAENTWMEHSNSLAGDSLRITCNSWYLGANIPGKKRVFMPYIGGVPAYRKKCEEEVLSDYSGFIFN